MCKFHTPLGMVQVLVIIHSQKIDLSQKRLFHGQKWQKQANKNSSGSQKFNQFLTWF